MLIFGAPTPATAAPQAKFTVPAGTLGAALIVLGKQAGISVGVSDPFLSGLPVAGFAGTATPAAALERLLRGLPAAAEMIDEQTYRIVRRDAVPIRHARSEPAADEAPAGEIVVSASKRGTLLEDYAGSAIVLDQPIFGNASGWGTEPVIEALPSLSSTHLGRGRNKLFIRGVADSSFNGPAQATVGQYLGDVRLTYAAPDPDLDLIDVSAVEVLEGPQGTLYGAGSLGGILRIVPEAVRLDTTEGALSASVATVAHGDPQGGASAMLNVPLIAGKLGIRAVAYGSADGGYIDDVGTGGTNVNHGRSIGGRLVARAEPGDGWAIEAGGVGQTIDTADGQYAERNLLRLTRRSALAQPFRNDYRLGQFVVTKDWDEMRLVSATGVVDQDVAATYDFTPAGGPPTIFTQDNRILLLSNETRVTRRNPNGSGWLIGSSFVSNDERLTRNLGPLPVPPRIIGVRNVVTEGAIYGEATFAARRDLAVTVGGRLSYDRLIGEPLDRTSDRNFEPNETEVRVLPSAAAGWHATDDLLIFVRYQQGYRPGGLSVATGAGTDSVERFHADSIVTGEAGFRYGRATDGVWNAAATLSYAHWDSIQADLVDGRGLPYSANIGTGRIYALEASASWRPVDRLRIDAALFLNDSRLDHPEAATGAVEGADLPNIARVGGRLGVGCDLSLPRGLTLAVDASARYVERSRLGVGPLLDIPQGLYLDTAVAMRFGDERFGVTFDATNLLDTDGNRFSLGDPFSVGERQQETPLRPRTFRIGVDARF